jgi:hypothetical protein
MKELIIEYDERNKTVNKYLKLWIHLRLFTKKELQKKNVLQNLNSLCKKQRKWRNIAAGNDVHYKTLDELLDEE